MKRITDYVGIGDVNPSAALHIAPLHADDVALKIQGTQNGTQTGNLMEIVDSSGTTVRVMDKNGVETITKAVTGSDVKSITGVVTGPSTGTLTVTRTVFNISSASSTVVTAATFTIPECGAVAVRANISTLVVCGADAGSGNDYRLEGMFVSSVAGSGILVGQTVTPVATGNATVAVALAGLGANSRTGALTVAGSSNAGTLNTWMIDMTTYTIPTMA